MVVKRANLSSEDSLDKGSGILVDPALKFPKIVGIADGVETQGFFTLVQGCRLFGKALSQGLVPGHHIDSHDVHLFGIELDLILGNLVGDRLGSLAVDFKAIQPA